MKIRSLTVAVSFAAMFFFATQSHAILIHLSSTPDLSGTPTLINGVGLGDTFDVYVLADDFGPSIIDAFELAVYYDTTSLSLFSSVYNGLLNVSSLQNELIVGTGGLSTTPEPVWLATFTFQSMSPSLLDSLITLGPVTVASAFPPEGNIGGVLTSDNELMPFSFASDLLVNQDSLPTPELYPASVPEPSIIWLLGSGLVLIGFARRKART